MIKSPIRYASAFVCLVLLATVYIYEHLLIYAQPRLLSGTGGLMPGIDPTKLATISQEMDDLEYVERMKRGFK